MADLTKLTSLIPIDEIEPQAMQQVYDNLEHDFLVQMALMPDIHMGYDLPIGAVALLDGKISPSYVGYDIGCGMCFLDTGVDIDAYFIENDVNDVYDAILKMVPMGVGVANERSHPAETFKTASGDRIIQEKVEAKINTQMGTLGGGNHFIEVGRSGGKNTLCITIHSGSRNPGHSVAGWYMRKGRFFDLESELGEAYYQDMNYCLRWALQNRTVMMNRVLIALGLPQNTEGMVNENHNHATVAGPYVLHRKGATPALLDQTGIIPANMRDGVWITRGLGNETYLSSASHGAGRTMSRNAAKKNTTMKQFEEAMEGITARVEPSTLDESPFAYKDISMVLRYQDRIVVDIIDHIEPIINLKG